MTIYKVLKNLSHIKTNEKLYSGAFCSDNPNASNGLKIIDGVTWYDGYLANRPQADVNVLLGYALDIVDKTHPDYDRLVNVGIIQEDKKKGAK